MWKSSHVREDAELEAVRTVEVETFGTPAEIAERFVGRRMLTDPRVRMFTAWIDGEPVGEASAYLLHDTVGIFGVGVVESARRRGIGAALTLRAARAFDDRTDLAWLQPSEMARRMYEGQGFRRVSDWEVWAAGMMKNGAGGPLGRPPDVAAVGYAAPSTMRRSPTGSSSCTTTFLSMRDLDARDVSRARVVSFEERDGDRAGTVVHVDVIEDVARFDAAPEEDRECLAVVADDGLVEGVGIGVSDIPGVGSTFWAPS